MYFDSSFRETKKLLNLFCETRRKPCHIKTKLKKRLRSRVKGPRFLWQMLNQQVSENDARRILQVTHVFIASTQFGCNKFIKILLISPLERVVGKVLLFWKLLFLFQSPTYECVILSHSIVVLVCSDKSISLVCHRVLTYGASAHLNAGKHWDGKKRQIWWMTYEKTAIKWTGNNMVIPPNLIK